MFLTLLTRIAVLSLALGFTAGQTKNNKTDAQIREQIVKDSLAAYKGNCPCPYSKNRAGRNCGGNSAYSRPGGSKPVCYVTDVTNKMIDDYRNGSDR